MGDGFVRVILVGPDQTRFEVEAPAATTLRDIVEEFLWATNYPGWSLMNWAVENDKGEGRRRLDPDRALTAHGIGADDVLYIHPATTAGCFSADASVLLSTGKEKAISVIEPGDEVIAYDLPTHAYKATRVQGTYKHDCSTTLHINAAYVMSEDQQLLTSTNTWKLARQIQTGDHLRRFPFSSESVTQVKADNEPVILFSLHLDDGLAPVVQGLVARDLMGKQRTPDRHIDIFLSYSSADRDDARDLYRTLTRSGKTVFLDERSIEPGDTWEEELKSALRACSFFWILITPNSLRSEWVTTEWAVAWALDKPIVPVLLRCRIDEIPHRLRRYHVIDLHRVGELLASDSAIQPGT